MEFKKTMKNNGTLVIKPIGRDLAKEMCVKHHYSKKWNSSFGKFNFGIFKENDMETCLGVAVFGNLMLPSSYKTINSNISLENIVELNRLWVHDDLGKNTETVFLSLCFKYFKKYNPEIKLVQSFADGRLGCGTIYKASNFKYYGYHETLFHENKDTGEVIHDVNLHNTARLTKMLGENLGLIRNCFNSFKVKTHRYVYYIDKEYEKFSLMNESVYPPYEKGVRYVEFKQSIHALARCAITYHAIDCIDLFNEMMSYLQVKYDEKEINEAIEKAKKNKYISNYLSSKKIKKSIEQIRTYDSKYQKTQ